MTLRSVIFFIDRGHPQAVDSVDDQGNTVAADQQYSEIVQVTALINVTDPTDTLGYRLGVKRGVDGTATRTDHPDESIIAKLDKSANASFITGFDLDNNGELDTGNTSAGTATSDIRIGVAEFGGTLTTNDYLILDNTEIVKVSELISTDIQALRVTDGGTPATEVFRVDSTTGNTKLNGRLSVGQGFDKFVVEGTNGNTDIAGTLTVNTLKVRGATVEGVEFFRLTNGGSTSITERTTLEVDTATGDLTINGGDIKIFGEDGTTEKLTFENSSGDLTVTGTLSAVGDGTATFGGDITVTGDITINGGDLTVNSGGDEIFAVDDTGGMTIASIENYITRTGGHSELPAEQLVQTEPNVNYLSMQVKILLSNYHH